MGFQSSNIIKQDKRAFSPPAYPIEIVMPEKYYKPKILYWVCLHANQKPLFDPLYGTVAANQSNSTPAPGISKSLTETPA
jgi:hypothetical protein